MSDDRREVVEPTPVETRSITEAPEGHRTGGVRLEIETARVERLRSAWGQVTNGDVVARLTSSALQSAHDSVTHGGQSSVLVPVFTRMEGATTVIVIGDGSTDDFVDACVIHALVDLELRDCERSAQQHFQRLYTGDKSRPVTPTVSAAR